MKKLFGYLRFYGKESILGPLLKLMEAGLELLVPLIVAGIIDRGIAEGDVGFIVRRTLLLAALGLLGLASSVTAQYFAARAAVGTVTAFKHDLFRHIGTLSYADTDKLGTSTLITRMTSDASTVQSGINLTLRLLLRSPFVVFGAMAMAFTIDTDAALTFVALIPVLSLIVFGVMLLTVPLYKKVQEGLDRSVLRIRENLEGVRVIRAFRKEDNEEAAFQETHAGLTKTQKKVGRIAGIQSPLTYVAVNLAIIALLYTGAVKVDSGILTAGQVVALYNYMSQILIELVKLANLIVTITKYTASANRMAAILDVTPSQVFPSENPETESGAPAVVFDGVSVQYGAGDRALKDVSFSVKRGATVGVIGGTGSGKSTLVSLIPRFYDASEGSVSLFGAPVTAFPKTTLRERIGVVPQKAVLFHGTVRDNLRFGYENVTDDALMRALEIAQAADVVAAKGGLDARVEEGGRNFSGGQRQRLTIARALARQPEILILDDSSSALDFATDKRLREALRTLPDEVTVFIVSQRTSSVQGADLILVLDEGRLVGMGRHEDLLRSCPVYREIHESQYGKEETV